MKKQDNRIHWLRCIGFGVAFFFTGWIFSFSVLEATENRIVEEDTDKDGRIDRIAHVDPSGKPVKLLVDRDGDGRLETVQFYENGQVLRIEKETDAAGGPDEIDFFENGKRVRHERHDAKGRISAAITFDVEERPVEWARDATGDGKLDTVQYYEAGKIVRVTRDVTGDGKPDVHMTYENEKPKEEQADRDGDGRIDEKVSFDTNGTPQESRHDTDKDGVLETTRLYQKGVLKTQEKDANQDGRPERVIEFENGQPVLEKQDSDNDGRFDGIVHMTKGKVSSREEDMDHDGQMDRFSEYDGSGRPLVVRETVEGNPKVTRYQDGKPVHMELAEKDRTVTTRFKNGKPSEQTIDEGKDGRIEQTVTFDGEGRVAKAVIDANGNGKPDTWQTYQDGRIKASEEDRNHDGKVDAKREYADGKPFRVALDVDDDGRFETVQRLNDPNWSMVTQIDANGDGRPEERYAFSGDVLREKELFDPDTGNPVLAERYDKAGHVIESRQAEGGAAILNITWHYDPSETAVLAEKDTDNDGKVDTWFHYAQGRVIRVEEDRNRDGKLDVVETYDASGAVVNRSEDLDFDGNMDIERKESL